MNKWLQVRMTEKEKRQVDDLARSYGMDTSSFVRAMIRFLDAERPTIEISSSEDEAAADLGKYLVLTPEMV